MSRNKEEDSVFLDNGKILIRETSQPEVEKYVLPSDSEKNLLLKKLFKHLLGFEEVFKNISDNYPHHNILVTNDGGWIIEVALAGFKIDDLSIYKSHSTLIIRGNKPEENDCFYTYKGIANRSFNKTFVLAEGTKVGKVVFKDGLLRIKIEGLLSHRNMDKININYE